MSHAWLFGQPIAHRGLHDAAAGIPENTLAAFAAATAAGYGIELDVRLSADCVPMVFHDIALGRLTGRDGRIGDVRADELETLRIADSDQCLPRLNAVLDLVRGRAPLLIEIKRDPGRLEPLTAPAVQRALAGYRGAYAVQSFHPAHLTWFRRQHAAVPRGLVAGDFAGRTDLSAQRIWHLRNLIASASARPDYIAYDFRAIAQPAARQARRRGLPLLAWTVTSRRELARARRYADNVIFEVVRPAADPVRRRHVISGSP